MRQLKYSIYSASTYVGHHQEPLTLLWVNIMDDEEMREEFEKKKKGAARVLLSYAGQVGGRGARDTFRDILTRVEAFARAHQKKLISTAGDIKKSRPEILDE